jgi:hypothetical protein
MLSVETDLTINCNKPSKEEVRRAITTLKNGKVAGLYNTPAEVIKAGTETAAVNILHNLFSRIWEKE